MEGESQVVFAGSEKWWEDCKAVKAFVYYCLDFSVVLAEPFWREMQDMRDSLIYFWTIFNTSDIRR